MIRNKNQFLVNSELYHIDSRQYANFQQSSVNLTELQKEVYCFLVKLSTVPSACNKIESDNPKNFKLVLQKFLYGNSFYSLYEYFELQKS
jgi:hypothetical protein